MKRIALVLFLLAVAVGAYAAGMASSGSLTQVITSTNTLASNVETAKVIWSGDKLRVEHYTMEGLIVEIQDGCTHYVYVPEKKSAIRMVLPKENTLSVQQLLESMSRPVKGGTKIGAETLNGFKCDIFTIKNDKLDGKFYISTDQRLPLKIKTIIKVGTVGQTFEIKDVKLNYNVSANLFKLPAGTKIEDKKVELPSATKNKTGTK